MPGGVSSRGVGPEVEKGWIDLSQMVIRPRLLIGSVDIPPSKSIAHRAIIAAALADGYSLIENFMTSKDMEATIGGMKSLGAEITVMDDGNSLKISGGSKIVTAIDIDCIESGSTLRFLIPLALVKNRQAIFRGQGRLVERPLGEYLKVFKSHGVDYSFPENRLPLSVKGVLESGEYNIVGGVSSQFITGLLFALPLLKGDSMIHIEGELESRGYIDLTIDVLKDFGIEIGNRSYKEFFIQGNQVYKSRNFRIEGDYSQAAFWLAAGVLGNGIRLNGLNIQSLQADKVILDILRAMGGNIVIGNDWIEAKHSVLKGIRIDVSQCPDLVPILAVLGTLGKGTTIIENAARARLKESDRLYAITTGLNKLGGNVEEIRDGLIINGVESLNGGEVDSFNDHRIAMALAVAATGASGDVIINGNESVHKSYPGFWDDFRRLGGLADEQ